MALFAALTNLKEVAGFFRVLAGILSPVVSGLLLAFVLSVPMLGIARRLAAHFPKMKEKTVDALSLTLTMLLIVDLSVPMFDVALDMDLTEKLKKMGITDVFDPTISDFSPMTDDTEAYLSQAKHAARIAIDEEGVTAAAYTDMMANGAAAPPEEKVDFTLDRPFVFAITGADGLPLFVGIVHQPQA